MRLRLIGVVLSLLFCISCENVTEGASYVTSSGVIRGSVGEASEDFSYLQRSAGAEISSDLSSKKAITDSDGNYELELPAGSHILTISKPSYGEMKLFNVVVPGPGTVTVPTVMLGEKPLGKFVIDSMPLISPPVLWGHSMQQSGHEYTRTGSILSLYHSAQDAGQEANGSDIIVSHKFDNSNTSINFSDIFSIYNAGFNSNSDLYIRVHDLKYSLTTTDTIGVYYDPIQKKLIYTAIGESGPVFHTKVP